MEPHQVVREAVERFIAREELGAVGEVCARIGVTREHLRNFRAARANLSKPKLVKLGEFLRSVGYLPEEYDIAERLYGPPPATPPSRDEIHREILRARKSNNPSLLDRLLGLLADLERYETLGRKLRCQWNSLVRDGAVSA